MGVGRGWQNGRLLEIGTKIKNFQKLEVDCLTDLILAITVLFADMTITLHTNRGSLFWCHAVMSLQFVKSAPLPAAESGCKTCEQIVIIVVFVA